jgi:hypothetical protein
MDRSIIVFIDGILIYLKNEGDHRCYVRQVLETLTEKLYAKFSKYAFWLHEVQFLGHVINLNGIVADLSYIEVVMQWNPPKTQSEIRSFLELAGSYRRFIQDFLKIALPLKKMTRKEEKFVWVKDQEEASQDLNKRLTQAPLLTLSDGNEDLALYSNASYQGLGCVLMQRGKVILMFHES